MVPKPNCSVCLKKCDRDLIDGVLYEVKICNCGRLYCGACALNNTKCFYKCEKRKAYPLLSKFCSFAKNAPEDEVQLVDLQYIYSDNCANCGTKRNRWNMLYRYKIQKVLCASCFEPSLTGNIWHTWEVKDSLLVGFISSLYPNCRPPVSHVQRPENNLPVKIRDLYCTRCREDIGSKASISCRPFILDGNPYCYECGANTCVFFSESHRCLCLCKFIDCIECIPENQLHLLTYSKWVKGVGCELHEDILNELSAVSADGKRKGKLRAFFKDGDIVGESLPSGSGGNIWKTSKTDSYSTNTTESELLSMLSTVDVTTPVTTIVCHCGREEDISNLFVCNTCSVYGVCGVCITRNHWGHDIQDTVKTLVTINCVNTQSELTLHKLSEWSGGAKELNQESKKSFKKLCSVLGSTFTEAAINSENQHRIRTLLENIDTSTLEKSFKNTVINTTKLHKAIDSFCEDLTMNADKEQEENISHSAHETSAAARELCISEL